MADTKTPRNGLEGGVEYDRAQQHYDRELSSIAKNYGTDTSPKRENDNIARLRGSESEAGKQVAGKSDSPKDAEANPYNYSAGKPSDKQKLSLKGLLGGSRKKKLIMGGATGGLVATLLTLMIFSPFGAFMQLKEMYSDWSTKHSRHAHLYRTSKVKAIRYFSDPDSCGGVAVKCKLKSGISDKEIKKLREAGFDIQDKDIATSKGGKKYLKRLRIDDKKGGVITINNPSEFAKQYRKNPRVLAKFEKVASTRSLMWRGKQSLKKLASFGVKRNAVIGKDASSQEDMTKAFRQEVYGNGEEGIGTADKPDDDPDSTADDNPAMEKALDDLDGSLKDQIAAAQADLVENGPHPDTILDPSQLGSSVDPADAVANATKSLGKTAVMGAVGSVDTTCVAYKYLARLSYLSKLMKAAALIKYAGIFMVAADAAKAGEITPTQAAFIGTILMRPSSKESSKGKTFGDSAGYTLITQGAIANPEDVGRFTNATPTLSKIQQLKKIVSVGGNTAGFCKKQQSWWGQSLTVAIGLGSTILTGGTSAIIGAAAKSTLAAVFFAVVGSYITPLILQYATGAIVPDPETDPEGGYGAGNALAAGAGAMGSQVGRASGNRPIKDDEFDAMNVAVIGDDALFAEVDELNGEASPLSRATDKLALALLPLTQSLASLNLFGFINGSATLIANSQGQLASPYTYAAGQDKYRDELCTDDDYEKMKLATDAFCNPIYAQTEGDVLGATYDPNTVIDYLLSTGKIDENGTPDEEFQEFIDVCINGSDPLISNGSEAELVGAEDTTRCHVGKNDENYKKYQYFRFFINDTDILDSDQAAVEDRLGHGDAAGLNSQGGAAFRIATFNILGANHDDDCPDGRMTGCTAPVDVQWPARLRRSTDVMLKNKLDIVGFQEFDAPQYNAFIKPEYGGNVYDIYPKEAGKGQNASRNSIVWDRSKFTMVSASLMKIQYFAKNPEPLVPVIKLQSIQTGQQFYVVNTHDPAGPDYAQERYDDALLHETKIKELSGEGIPVFYTGDFNSGYSTRSSNNTTLGNKRENLAYCILTREQTMWDALDAVDSREGVCPTRMDKGGGPVDHIFFSKAVTASGYDKAPSGRMRNGSDVHDTIWVDIVIPGGGAVAAVPYSNPVYKGFAADPGIIRGDDRVFHVYYTGGNIGHLTSNDLVNWKKVDGQTVKGAPGRATGCMWAPDVARMGTTFVLTWTGGGGDCSPGDSSTAIHYATSKNAGGPFNYKGIIRSDGYAIDSQIFNDEDGKSYLYYGGGNIKVVQVKLEGDTLKSVGAAKARLMVRDSAATVEGEWVVKRNGWYYLFYSYGKYKFHENPEYSVRIARSKSPMGPFEPGPGPGGYKLLLKGKSPYWGPGHNSVIKDDAGNDWMVYHAWYKGERQLLIDPISWSSDDWPVMTGPSHGLQSGPMIGGQEVTGAPSSAWAWPLQKNLNPGPCYGGAREHAGMDINSSTSDNPVTAMHDGVVERIGLNSGAAGNYVMIKANGGGATYNGKPVYYSYEHLKGGSIVVKEKAQVKVGQKIGIAGLSGNVSVGASKAHLHVVTASTATLGAYGSLGTTFDPMKVLAGIKAPEGYKCY